MSKDSHDPKSVSVYIQKLEPGLRQLVEAIRQLILSSDASIGEQVKWNSPAFFYTGDMKPFDPKEFKRDLIVIHVRKGFALLVLPTGAKIKKNTALLEGDYKDGRRMVTLKTLEEVTTKGKALQKTIQEWLGMVDQ